MLRQYFHGNHFQINKYHEKVGGFALRKLDVNLVINMQNKGSVPKTPIYRKTSAEIVKEAQSTLAISGTGHGAKLVSTRRPITPNVNNRELYGTASFTNGNRPPSAFNLKYLQYEMRALPCLEPINQSKSSQNLGTQKVRRSSSIGAIHEALVKTRLPALIEIPASLSVATVSLEDRKFSKLNKLNLLNKVKYKIKH